MKIILGLGNPGIEYTATRHNVGMMLVDLLSQKISSSYGWRKHYDAMIFRSAPAVLVKSKSVFMNESGKLLQGLPEGIVYVAHDDLDIRLGEYKIQLGVGPKLHYGIQAVESGLGHSDFWRIRIGVDNRDPYNRMPGEAYVLQRFTDEERQVIDNVLNKIASEIFKTNS